LTSSCKRRNGFRVRFNAVQAELPALPPAVVRGPFHFRRGLVRRTVRSPRILARGHRYRRALQTLMFNAIADHLSDLARGTRAASVRA
jgi:hypothetical protein